MNITQLNGLTLYELAPEGALLGADLSATDLIGEAYEANPDLLVVPITRLARGFLDLSTRIAGEVFQKMEQYNHRLVILGDISTQLAASKALQGFVYETNQRAYHLFVPERSDLLARLAKDRKRTT